MTTAELGRLVRARRKELGMDQIELAMVAGTGPRFIGELENGKGSCHLGKTLGVLASLGFDLLIQPKKGG